MYRDYHYILTLMTSHPTQGHTVEGVVMVGDGATRAAVYADIRRQVLAQHPHLASAVTVCWSIGLNQL